MTRGSGLTVVRGRRGDVAADAAVTEELLARAGREGEPVVRLWCPPRHVAFGRADTRADGYERARATAAAAGYAVRERGVGGRAVAYDGTTPSVAWAVPTDDPRTGIDEGYERLLAWFRRSLSRIGVETTGGEPPDSWCPGTHSLTREGKVAGLAQRRTSGASLLAAIILVDGIPELRELLETVYDQLGLSLDPATVDGVGRDRPDVTAATLLDALVATAPAPTRTVDVDAVDTSEG